MSSTQKPVLILGTTSYAEVVVDIFEYHPLVDIVGFVENLDRSKAGSSIMSRPVYWYEDCLAFRETHVLVAVLGTTYRREWIETMADSGYSFTSLIHASSIISARSDIGTGSIVDAGSIIAGYSQIAPHVRVGRRTSIGHHTSIGSFSTIHPGAIVSGKCNVGEQVTVGTGAVLIDRINIGDGAYLAAGAIVTQDIPNRALAAGNPARIIKENYGPK